MQVSNVGVWVLLIHAVQGEYADAAFSEVVSKSLANTVNFGEAIVLGRRYPLPCTNDGACRSVQAAFM